MPWAEAGENKRRLLKLKAVGQVTQVSSVAWASILSSQLATSGKKEMVFSTFREANIFLM